MKNALIDVVNHLLVNYLQQKRNVYPIVMILSSKQLMLLQIH